MLAKRTTILLIGCLGMLLMAFSTPAGPKFSRGTAVSGVVAYQDDSDPTQFYYLPARVPVVLGSTLSDFKVTYWGIGKIQLVQASDGSITSRTGAIVAGRAALDITDAQRKAIGQEITNAYGVANPKLLPLSMSNVQVQPVIGTNTLDFGPQSDVVFPSTVSFGSTFEFLVGTGNSLFAQLAAREAPVDNAVIPNPQFGINVVGDVEFVGDPWSAKCTADLSQVWNKVRTQISASVSLGWFRIGSAQYSSIVQDLTRSGVIKCTFQEGSLDNEKYGRQVLELGKKVFEDLNAKAGAGEGFFKFEPNPEPQAIDGSQSSGWWPWSVSINGGYSSAHFNQSIAWASNVTYTGRFKIRVPASMVLAVDCNSATAANFVELSDTQPCITQEKSDALNARLDKERAAKNVRIYRLLDKLENGQITPAQYQQILAIYNTVSFTEDLGQTPASGLTFLENGQRLHALDMTIAAEPKRFTVGMTSTDIDKLEQSIIKSNKPR